MFKKVYSLYSAFCTQSAFYSQSAVSILHSVCILPLVRSLQSAVRSLRFTLTGNRTGCSSITGVLVRAQSLKTLTFFSRQAPSNVGNTVPSRNGLELHK